MLPAIRRAATQPPRACSCHACGPRTQTRASSVEEALDVRLAEAHSTPGALAIACLQVAADALLAEHMAALGDDDVLLALVAHVAVQQLAHGLHLQRAVKRATAWGQSGGRLSAGMPGTNCSPAAFFGGGAWPPPPTDRALIQPHRDLPDAPGAAVGLRMPGALTMWQPAAQQTLTLQRTPTVEQPHVRAPGLPSRDFKYPLS